MSSIIGVYGMGVMGQSLALNIANHGYAVSVYNKDDSATRQFLGRVQGQRVTACFSEKELVGSLEKPRRILMMVTAGKVVDEVMERLLALLEPGDILIDGGNSYFKDTQAREKRCAQKGVYFFGVGVSGGEMGALKGPSIMPSGDRTAYAQIAPILNDIAAKTDDQQACCSYIGPDGSGHYVKMVHNGIEYGDIQIICEAYDLLRRVGGLSVEEIQQVFEQWNQGWLKSYLIEITAKILKVTDEETGLPLIDVILDTAEQKGTGKWTSMEGLDLGTAIPTIAESVFARCLSANKKERVAASRILDEKPVYPIERQTLIADLEKALICAKILSYAQGFSLLRQAGETYGWKLNYGEIALLWRQGCIIRAEFLNDIKEAFDQDPRCANLMVSDKFSPILKENAAAFRRLVAAAILNGVYVPALSSALEYYDGYRSEHLPANLLQAQRDFFGAHTYRRTDRNCDETFHTVWEEAE